MSRKEAFSHLDYRNAKIIHLIEKDESERFIYKNRVISKEEAIEIVWQYKEEKKSRKEKKKCHSIEETTQDKV